jgi:hypothetical protein
MVAWRRHAPGIFAGCAGCRVGARAGGVVRSLDRGKYRKQFGGRNDVVGVDRPTDRSCIPPHMIADRRLRAAQFAVVAAGGDRTQILVEVKDPVDVHKIGDDRGVLFCLYLIACASCRLAIRRHGARQWRVARRDASRGLNRSGDGRAGKIAECIRKRLFDRRPARQKILLGGPDICIGGAEGCRVKIVKAERGGADRTRKHSLARLTCKRRKTCRECP